MLRLVLVTLFLLQVFHTSVTQEDDENSVLKDLFDAEPDSNCSSIEGDITSGGGCYECYICNDYGSRIQKERNKKDNKIRFYDSKCNATEFCCYSQQDSIVRYTPSNCGKSNPAGVPRRTRNTLRSVLQGEYPWRTWIFSKTDLKKPICAGVFIDINSRAILTSANCVDDYTEDDLRVRFYRQSGSLRVRDLIIHDDYERDTRHHDIAILVLTLNEELPHWAQVACLPTTPIRQSTACIAVSNDDNYINSLIPTQNRCFNEKQLHESVLCTLAPRGDYEPEFSGGLFCEQEISVTVVRYGVFGIYLYNDHGAYVYTNIVKYGDWIENSLKSYI